jgi:MFS family permease
MPEPTSTPVSPAVRRARVAVAVLFVANGITLSNLIPWYPVVKSDLVLSNTMFGIAVAAYPLGALALGAGSGPLIARLGSGRTATAFAVVTAAFLPAVALAPNFWTFAGAMTLMGAGDAITDAAMNSHGLRVQRRYGRSIINSFHALWSSGAVAGGLVGSAAIGLGLTRPVHLSGIAVLVIVLVLVTGRWLLPGPEHAERTDEANDDHGAGLRAAVVAAPLVLLGLGVLLMASTALEDTAGTWSGVYLKEVVAAPAGALGLGFVAAQVLMVLGRVTGDRVVDRLGPVNVARWGLLLSASGMLVVVLSTNLYLVLLGFGMSGLGVSTIYPLGMVAAGEIPGVRSGDGVTLVAWLGRVGFLVVPPVIGAVADAVSLPAALAMVVAAAVGGSFLAPLLRPRDVVPTRRGPQDA